MPEPLTAIVLAGGLGTRLRSTVPDLPKPMAPIAGRPFLEILLEYWIAQGVSRFVLSVGYRADAIADHFGSRWQGTPIVYAREHTPLGTGGALLLALKHLHGHHERVLLLNGDTFFAVSLNTLSQFASDTNATCCLTLFSTRDTSRYLGVTRGTNGRVLGLGSHVESGVTHANGGVYLLSPTEISNLGFQPENPCSLELDLLPKALALNHLIYAYVAAGMFIDIGVPHDYHRAQSLNLMTSPLPTTITTT